MLLRHIRYLKAVADLGSFTRAAQTLHVSQPALSQQIKELELRLGAQLLDRSGRRVRPTDLGRAYLERVGRALRELDEGARALRDVEDLSAGTVRLGITPTVGTYLIGPVSRRFRASYPNIMLSITVSSHEEFEPALMDDKIDLGIGFADLPSDDIEVIALHEERFVLIVSAKRGGARRSVVSAANVANMPMALLTPTFSIRRMVDRYFREQGFQANVVVEANSVSTLIDLVRSTDLATILPENVAGPGLSTVKIKPGFEPRRAALLRRRNAYCSAAARAFIATVQGVSGEYAEA
ncbi:transcriptional regulator CynR [Bradyrhizobium sp. U87765 SZCCT0131]|uniref:transcriptional regulator CynR n=1 Tax=unclassified Bradyrhizobium TaxID=2631580 RepID=UPI001BA93158|nr:MULTISPECIES: transcriptional regulator CynR [unclassified Bradyrhizobium]MBR1222451.1 transcriptional regulator CynR [Bradyrhizobium sp. U87765 SZCCT0131]MBR1264065.1 transcriptional regulator CynR [Bradyrhizobium sp. U87765 SZCCT0134]MBR1308152.1 transcriptional regulator CynR [Bradyrhizobium sp. U87765 SZCCT0110]MBR1320315.1 transcriptional regulator CynR [Bradyrhizobium sp. U87765 SZCCT0109]MBR1348572.1 transcriptional regulator CynR [Bradyrhizobium sp. U87765 SZCCT0048]